NNNNDILAANLFDLGCLLSQGTKFSEKNVMKCSEDVYVRPKGGLANKAGFYRDTFKTFLGCDSIILTNLVNYQTESSVFSKNLCKGDGSDFLIGDTLYNEMRPQGLLPLQNRLGCDSFILVRLTYNPTHNVDVNLVKCSNSDFEYKVGNDLYNFKKPNGKTIVKNRFNCDSTVNVNIDFLRLDTTIIYETICINKTLNYDQKEYDPDSIYQIIKTGSDDCDSLISLQIKSFRIPEIAIDTNITIRQYETYVFKNTTEENLIFKWNADEDFSCFDCLNPSVRIKNYSNKFLLEIIDQYFCNYSFDIIPKYVCDPIFPNIFNPFSTNNSKFELKNDCPLNLIEFKIFDRFGNLVYISKEEPLWDGTFNQKVVLPGVYSYTIKTINDNEIQWFVGDVTVVY
ncbi:MAG: hypothetical protein RLZZ546_300, partial [Bacteroidota bacterium]